MFDPQPTLSLDVDPANPGQFLACCGLLELASRLDEEALGWFDERCFHLYGNLGDLMKHLLTCRVCPFNTEDAQLGERESTSPSPPIRLDHPFDLVLNWWEDEGAVRSGFKTWSGGQTVMGFVTGMRDVLRDHANHDLRLLNETYAIDKPKPFYFDSRLARLTAIDMGFSTETFTASYSPGVELLTLVGLQRFRPITIELRERYGYHTWHKPAPLRVAAAIAHGLIPSLSCTPFVFPLVVRTGGKYKAFGPATLIWSHHA